MSTLHDVEIFALHDVLVSTLHDVLVSTLQDALVSTLHHVLVSTLHDVEMSTLHDVLVSSLQSMPSDTHLHTKAKTMGEMGKVITPMVPCVRTEWHTTGVIYPYRCMT